MKVEPTTEEEYSVDCRQCGSRMQKVTVRKFPSRWSWVLIALGVVFSLFIVGVHIGIPMLLLGAYMATAKVNVSQCQRCGYFFKVLPS